MLQELNKRDFSKVVSLFTGDKVNLEPQGVAYGYNPGWIYVDNYDSPRSALIWVKGMEGFYFAGDAKNSFFNNQIEAFLAEVVLPKAKSMNYKWIEMSGMSPDWEVSLARIFSGRKGYAESRQFVYKHQRLQDFKANYQLKSNYRVKAIDQKLLAGDISNYDHLESIILNWWESFEDFLKHGIGFCVMHNTKIICTCLTSFRKKGQMALDIHTLKEYRQQGCATVAASLFLEYCQANNLEPYWDCMETNYASRALAVKLGYQKQFEYMLFEFLV